MRLYVPLRRDEFDRLAALARAERRSPQDQAAVLIGRALAARPAEVIAELSVDMAQQGRGEGGSHGLPNE